MDPHRLAELRSIALHCAVAERLRTDAHLIDAARARIRGWVDSGRLAPRDAGEWERLLALPIDDLCTFLVEDTEEARTLRQSTPFAGVIDPRTRWRIWRQEAERGG
jgi:hypothetical protein